MKLLIFEVINSQIKILMFSNILKILIYLKKNYKNNQDLRKIYCKTKLLMIYYIHIFWNII